MSVAKKCVSATFKEENKLQDAVQRLLNRGIPKEDISIIGRNFKSEAKITGFLTKKDIILDGLTSGALYGSLFGSVLSLGQWCRCLVYSLFGGSGGGWSLGSGFVGATSGALYGAIGAGLGSVLISFGMAQDRAAIYQTRVQAGEFLIVVEVPADKSGEIFLLLQGAGGEEVATTDMQIPRGAEGKLEGTDAIAPDIRSGMSEEAQQEFVESYNQAYEKSPENALMEAWKRIKQLFDRDDQGIFSRRK
jgi:hypothetical protein